MFWPRIEGNVGIMVSIVARMVVKVITDFTGCLDFRHPYELGKQEARSNGLRQKREALSATKL